MSAEGFWYAAWLGYLSRAHVERETPAKLTRAVRHAWRAGQRFDGVF